jgi:hypothetical protein
MQKESVMTVAITDVVKCRDVQVDYDFKAKSGQIFVPAGCEVEKEACIEYFRAIDPNVKSIHAARGGTPHSEIIKRLDHWEIKMIGPTDLTVTSRSDPKKRKLVADAIISVMSG